VARDSIKSGSSARIYRRAAADMGGLLSDGRPLDSGSAMRLASEINHLISECAPRQLVNCHGPGSVVVVNSDWNDLNEQVPDATARSGYEHMEIAWSATSAMRFGPFPGVRDRPADEGAMLLRKVRAAVRAKSDGTNTLSVYVAATATKRPPSDGYLAFRKATMTSSTAATLFDSALTDLDLRGVPAVSRPEPVSALGEQAVGGYVEVPEFWLWLGYKHAGATPAYVLSVAFWELPPS
jgi:hypothetical protein